MLNFLNVIIVIMSATGFALFYTFMNPSPLNERLGGFAFMTFVLAFLTYVIVSMGYVSITAIF
jgi:hypothetical protein